MNFDTSESEEDVVQPMPSRNGRGRRRDDAADVGNSSGTGASIRRIGGHSTDMPSSLETRPPVVRLEDEPRNAGASKVDYTTEEKEWKKQSSSVDERKKILTKLLSRHKDLNTRRRGSETRVGLDVGEDSDDPDYDENKPQKLNFTHRQKLRSYLLEMRSGMPPKDVDNALSSHGRQQHVQHYDMELMKRMDAEAFADISSIVSRQCANILSSPDMVTIKRVCAHAQADLATYGISQLQLWTTCGINQDTLESSGWVLVQMWCCAYLM